MECEQSQEILFSATTQCAFNSILELAVERLRYDEIARFSWFSNGSEMVDTQIVIVNSNIEFKKGRLIETVSTENR